jgi:hypothetical protein
MILPDNWHETDATTTDWMVVPCSMGRHITPVGRSGSLRELYPVQVGVYVIARGIQYEPAFAWQG